MTCHRWVFEDHAALRDHAAMIWAVEFDLDTITLVQPELHSVFFWTS